MLKWAQLGIYYIENGEMRYGWGFILLKRNLIWWNCWNKVRLGICFIENTKIKYGWDLFYWKSWNKVWLEIYFIEDKVRLRINPFKSPKIRQDWRFILLNTKKLDTAVDLFHWKCWNTLQLRISSIQNAEIKCGCEFIPMKKAKIKRNLGFIPLKRLK